MLDVQEWMLVGKFHDECCGVSVVCYASTSQVAELAGVV
jgi:hypothetical protein